MNSKKPVDKQVQQLTNGCLWFIFIAIVLLCSAGLLRLMALIMGIS